MGNFGELSVQFYDASLDLLYDNGGTLNTTGPGTTTLYPLRARGESYFKRIGRGSFAMMPADDTYPLIQVGHFAVVWVSDAIASADLPVACFRIDQVEVVVEDDIPMLEISGPDLLQELVEWMVHEDVGTQEIVTTQIRYNKGIGETDLVIDDATDFDDGDDVVIRNGILTVLYRGVINGAPSIGTGPGGEDEIVVAPPLYNAVAFDNYITATDYRNPTTEDITQIMNRVNQFVQWQLTVEGGGDGTAAGTSHAANNQTTFDMLNAAAGMTGEWYRLLARASGSDAPLRELEWRSTSDSSGVTLIVPDQADVLTNYTDTSKGIIESVRREYKDGRISHCIPTGGGGGDEVLTLADATDSAPAGYTLTVNESLGYAILAYDALATEFSPSRREVAVSFSHIRPSGTSDDAREVAGNQLLSTAVQFMAGRNEKFRFYRIVAVVHKELEIGQSIVISYTDTHFTLSETLYISELECNVDEEGVRKYTMLCGEALQTRITGDLAVVSRLASAEGAVGNLSVGAVGGVSGGASHNPVTLNADSGLTLSGQELAMGTPSTLTAATSNAVSGAAHSHAATTTSDADSTPSTILAGDANGRLKLDGLGIGIAAPAASLHVGDVTTAGVIISNRQTALSSQIPAQISWAESGAYVAGDLLIAPRTDIAGAIRLFTGTGVTERLTVLGDGNVGVGISPTYKFHVSGSVGIDGDLTFVGAQQITTTAGALTVASTGNLVLNPVTGTITADADFQFTGAQSITTSADSLTIAPANDLILDPVGDNAFVGNTVNLGAAGHVSGLYGSYWGIDTPTGFADFRAIQAEEAHFWVAHFTETLISSGDAVITKYSSRIADGYPFTVPAVSSSGTIRFKDSESVGAGATHPEGGWVQLQLTNFAQTDFLIARVWGQVYSYADQGDGTHAYTFTTRYSVFATAGLVAKEASPAIGWGLSGDPFIIWSLNDILGAPYIRTGYWNGANPYTASNRHITTQTGNLGGLAGYQNQNGFFAGSLTGAHVAVTDWGAAFVQVPISMYYNDTSDDGRISLYALELNSDVESNVKVNGDLSQDEVVRSSGAGTWFSHIDDDPATGQPDSDFIRNTDGLSAEAWFNVQDLSHTLTELDIEVYVARANFDDDVCQLRAQMFKDDDVSELTNEVVVYTSSAAGGLYTVIFTGVDTTALDAEWAAARLRLRWVYTLGTTGADEVVKIDPAIPSIAVGNAIPTGTITGGAGFWAGRHTATDTYRLRIGGTPTLGKPALVWDSTDLEFRNSAGDAVITLDGTAGTSYFAGVMTIGTSGEIRQGTGTLGVDFDGIRIYNNSGVGTFSSYNNDDEIVRHDENGISIVAVDKFSASSVDWFDSLGGTNHFSVGVDVDLGTIVGAYLETSDILTITANQITIADESAGSAILTLNLAYAWLDGGMRIGDYAAGTPNQGQLILDQGAGDYVIFQAISSDVAHGLTGITDTDVFVEFGKVSATNGGVFMRGLTDGTVGVNITAHANTMQSAAPSTSSTAAIVLNVFEGESTTPGAGDHLVAMRSASSTTWLLLDNGDVYIDGTQNTYDGENDMQVGRALLRELNPIGFIRSAYDKLNPYSRDDLIELGLMSDGGLRNETRSLTLALAQGWQLHEENRQLSDRIRQLENIIYGNN